MMKSPKQANKSVGNTIVNHYTDMSNLKILSSSNAADKDEYDPLMLNNNKKKDDEADWTNPQARTVNRHPHHLRVGGTSGYGDYSQKVDTSSQPSDRRIFERRSTPSFTRSRAPGQPQKEGFHIGNKDYLLYQGADHQAVEDLESNIIGDNNDDNNDDENDTTGINSNIEQGNDSEDVKNNELSHTMDDMNDDNIHLDHDKPKHLKHKKMDRRKSNTMPLQTFVTLINTKDTDIQENNESHSTSNKDDESFVSQKNGGKKTFSKEPPQLDDLDDFPCLTSNN